MILAKSTHAWQDNESDFCSPQVEWFPYGIQMHRDRNNLMLLPLSQNDFHGEGIYITP